MIYSDNCCCCIGLKCGSVLIAIIEVLIRGLDRFFVDRKLVVDFNEWNNYIPFSLGDSVMGFFSLIVSGIYVISCIFLFFGALLGLRCCLLPYLSISCLRFLILVVEGVFVATEGIVNNYLVFDLIQSVLGLYFWLVVFSYYDRLKNE
ncbi:hypothetical protein KR038_010209 [Drosophila bunnanda]|nr:hypothetical protein KR038_010209 [Drosophila bunnanda]